MDKDLGTFRILIIILITVITLIIPLVGSLPIVSHSQLPYLLSNQQPRLLHSSETLGTMITKGQNFGANNKSIAIFNSNNNSDVTASNNRNKVAIINFDDGYKDQYIYAKPILDKYGFKATFFIVCNYVGHKNRMDWQEIESLYKDGYDIESHTMSHKDLSKMSPQMLNYEIGQSKQCLLDYDINSTIFAYPSAKGSDNSTVVNVVAKYYDLARTGFSPVTFLKCDGWKKNSSQTDCRTYFDNGTLTFSNRYSIRGWEHERILGDNNTFTNNYRENYNYNNYNNASYYINYLHDNKQTLQNFIKVVNSPQDFNKRGKINAIPIITYHKIVNGTAPYGNLPITIDIALFDLEMKYLHDNSFRVISLKDIGYDESNKYLYIKN